MQKRQCVIPAVPGEECGVALTIGDVEGPVECLDSVVAEEGRASVLQAVEHA